MPIERKGRGFAAAAGVVGAAVSLGAGELLAALLDGVPSPVVAVGDLVIDSAPVVVRERAIEALGTADKPALVVGIVVVSLVLGALVGLGARRSAAMAPTVFGTFGGLGILAASADPATSLLPAIVAFALAAAAGVVAVRQLLQLAPAASTAGPLVDLGRRRFVTGAVAAGALALVAGSVGQAMRRGGKAAAARARTVLRRPASPLAPPPPAMGGAPAGLSPLFTPLDRFFRIDTAITVPDVDVATWRLRVSGLVDRPFSLTYEELAALPQVEADITLCCVSNEVGGRLVGTARWQGVLLRDLLDRAGVQPGASQLVGRSVEGFTVGFPTSVLADGRRALVALGMAGEPLPLRHGFPARLVVPGLYGYVSATKWLEELELTTLDAFDAYWVPRGWAKEAPIKTSARIDVPRAGQRLAPGRQAVAGVAWAPTRGIARVEVQVDDGPWAPAELGPEVSADAWRQWVWAWEAEPGEHVVRARATDGTGAVQEAQVRPPAPDGASGLHRVQVVVSSTAAP